MKSFCKWHVAAAVVAGLFAAAARAEPECGSLENGYGPFDFRTSKRQLHIVEVYHFTSDVEGLRHGSTSSLGGDLDYTLRASPNHHRALNSMMNLALRDRVAKPNGAHYTIDCYFDRAMRLAPDDGVVQLLYGIYLSRTNRKPAAVRAFESALKFEHANANLYYNLGLVYFDLKDYPNALKNAQRAYRLGMPLPGLRDKLKQAGQWSDPAPAGEGSGDPVGAPADAFK